MSTDKLLAEVDEEKLEAHVRARLTPEMVEYVRRLAAKFEVCEGAPTSGEFCYRLGIENGKAVILEAFEGLLTEHLDPENQ